MKNPSLEILPIIFSLVILAFFLPFINVSCSRQKVASVTGIQLVSGTVIQRPGGSGKVDSQQVKPEPEAITAFVSGILGLVVSFVRGKPGYVGSAGAGFVGGVALLLLKSRLDKEAVKHASSMLVLEYDIGFWVAFVLFLAAIAAGTYLHTHERTREAIAKRLSAESGGSGESQCYSLW
ncbi:MAG: hypothetical protein ACP5ON_10705 [Bacteroidota bacterium]